MILRKRFLLALAVLAGCAPAVSTENALKKNAASPTLPPLSLADAASVTAFAAAIDQMPDEANPPAPAEPREYGDAVNSLAMHIDGFVREFPEAGFFVIRIRNVGRSPVLLPANWRGMLSYSINTGGAWGKYSEASDGLGTAVDAQGVQRAPFELNPGETAGAILGVIFETPGSLARVRLKCDADPSSRDFWSGELVSRHFDSRQEWHPASLPTPTFPEPLDMTYHYGEGEEYALSTHDRIRVANWRFDEARRIYDRAGRRIALEKWLADESDDARRAYLAGEIAGLGGRSGMKELLRHLGSTEYQVADSARQSLGAAINNFSQESLTPPAVLVELALAAIADTRPARDVQEEYPYKNPTMQLHARSVIEALVRAKCNRVVPALIAIVQARRPEMLNDAIRTLGLIGDRSAIPSLVDYLGATKQNGKLDEVALETLAKLRAAEAVPMLLECMAGDNNCIEALGDIGDTRAIEPLEKIVAAGGKLTLAERNWVYTARLEAAKRALEKIRAAELTASSP